MVIRKFLLVADLPIRNLPAIVFLTKRLRSVAVWHLLVNLQVGVPPLSWQTYDVEFTAAKFDTAGKKTTDAETTIRHNGVVIHDKLKFPKATPGGAGVTEVPPGSIFLQNHGDPVVFQNIWIVEKK